MFEPRPQEHTRESRHDTGEQPSGQTCGNRGNVCGDRGCEHIRKEERRLRSLDVASEHAGERQQETDHEHDGRGNWGAERGRGSESNERSPTERCRRVGHGPRPPRPAEVRHDQQPETSEDGEGGDLQVADDEKRQRENGRIDDCCTRGAVQGNASRVGALARCGTRRGRCDLRRRWNGRRAGHPGFLSNGLASLRSRDLQGAMICASRAQQRSATRSLAAAVVNQRDKPGWAEGRTHRASRPPRTYPRNPPPEGRRRSS